MKDCPVVMSDGIVYNLEQTPYRNGVIEKLNGKTAVQWGEDHPLKNDPNHWLEGFYLEWEVSFFIRNDENGLMVGISMPGNGDHGFTRPEGESGWGMFFKCFPSVMVYCYREDGTFAPKTVKIDLQ